VEEVIRDATREDGEIVGALIAAFDTQAEGLWRAAGYRDDVEIGRWVRSLG
jgi:hypothetical protein